MSSRSKNTSFVSRIARDFRNVLDIPVQKDVPENQRPVPQPVGQFQVRKVA